MNSYNSHEQTNNKKIIKGKVKKEKNRLKLYNKKLKITEKNSQQKLQSKKLNKLYVNNKIKTSDRLHRYNTKIQSNNLKKTNTKLKKGIKFNNINNEFRYMKDLPLAHLNKNKSLKNSKKQIIINKENIYSLPSSKNVLSPIGSVAKMLMNIVMKSKNKKTLKP